GGGLVVAGGRRLPERLRAVGGVEEHDAQDDGDHDQADTAEHGPTRRAGERAVVGGVLSLTHRPSPSRGSTGARALVAGPTATIAVATESVDHEGIVGPGGRRVAQSLQELVVAGARELELLADGSLLGALELPPRALEV